MECSPPDSSVHGILQTRWSRLPFSFPENLPDPGIKFMFLMSPVFAGGFFSSSTTWGVQSELPPLRTFKLRDWDTEIKIRGNRIITQSKKWNNFRKLIEIVEKIRICMKQLLENKTESSGKEFQNNNKSRINCSCVGWRLDGEGLRPWQGLEGSGI